MRKLLVILGIPVDDVTTPEAIDRIRAMVQEGRQTGKTHLVVTVNSDFGVKALRDQELRMILQEADLATADGMPLVWASKLLGIGLRERVTGADLVPRIASMAAEEGYRLFLLGAAPGVAAKAAEQLVRDHPGLQIAGVLSPPYAPLLEMDPGIVAQVSEAEPDILLVAFGNPKQEKWISMHAATIHVPVAMGVGGTLDFIAGTTLRAPSWMQHAGLEWLYRLTQEPRRLWRRYVTDLINFAYFFGRQWWRLRARRSDGAPLATTRGDMIRDMAVISVSGRLDASTQSTLAAEAERALEITPDLAIDLRDATLIDSAGIGALVALAKQARDQGGDLFLLAVPRPIEETLRLIKLDTFFQILPSSRHADEARTQRARPYATMSSDANPDEVVLGMPRRIDAASVAEMTEAVERALAQHPRVTLDLGETVFLSSAGIAAMVSLNRLAVQDGGSLRLVGCSPDIVRTLRLLKIDQVMPIQARNQDHAKQST
jgi:N-acetylglucosaminyldiphosphoundecaprenol N-acetyl-beta-D-mannosaminyltransferase